MNFLAHCLLANATAEHAASLARAADSFAPGELRDGLIAGGVIGEFVKGRIPEALTRSLFMGVALHRRIDAVSNQDAALRNAANRFPPALRRYAPIYVDILADHALSLDWDRYATEALDTFSMRCTRAFDGHRGGTEPIANTGVLRFLDWLADSQVLANYHQWHLVETAIKSVNRRLGQPALNAPALTAAAKLAEPLRADFADAFPSLLSASLRWYEAWPDRDTPADAGQSSAG